MDACSVGCARDGWSNSVSPRVRLLIVGLGRQGHRHVRAALACSRISEVLTADPMTQGIPGIRHFDSAESALTQGSPNAVIVAVPTELHAAVAMGTLARGLPTLVEKPLAARTDDAAKMLEFATAQKVTLFVGHVERFNPVVRLVSEMLKQGRLGQPLSLAFRRVGLPPMNKPKVDVVHDLGVHDIDVFAFLAKQPVRLAGAVGWPDGLTEAAHLLLRAGDVTGSVQCNWRTPVRVRDFTVTTDTAYVEANYTTQRVEVFEPSDPADFEEFAAFQSHYGLAHSTTIEARPAEPLIEQINAFTASVEGALDPQLATGYQGLEALAIADEAERIIKRA